MRLVDLEDNWFVFCQIDTNRSPFKQWHRSCPRGRQFKTARIEQADKHEREIAMAIPGNWTLHFDWFCTGNYAATDMTFNADGSWTMSAFGYTGRWSEVSGELVFNFSGLPTVYSGNFVVNAAVGAMTTFNPGENGCWYLLRKVAATAQKVAPSHDPAGKPTS
jgi:hypothetical protein